MYECLQRSFSLFPLYSIVKITLPAGLCHLEVPIFLENVDVLNAFDISFEKHERLRLGSQML